MTMLSAEDRMQAALEGKAAYLEVESQTRAFIKFRIRLKGESIATGVRVHKSHPKAFLLEQACQ